MANYLHLYNTLQMLLKSSQADFVVTTFIDFFRIPTNIPKYEECVQIADKEQQIRAMEKAIDESMNDRRFFSYIQKHEFEALCFRAIKVLSIIIRQSFRKRLQLSLPVLTILKTSILPLTVRLPNAYCQ